MDTSKRTLRFSRTVKADVGGQGVTVALVMEVEAVWLTDPALAELSMVDKGGGRLGLQLKPQPANAVILTATASAVDFSNRPTATEVVDVTKLIEAEAEEEAVMERAGQIITPDISDGPSRRASLLGGVNNRPLQVF